MQTARLLPLAALVIACSAEAPAPPSEAGVPDVVLLPSVCDALASLASEPPIPAIPAQKETLPAVAAFTAEEATDAVTLTGGGLEIVSETLP